MDPCMASPILVLDDCKGVRVCENINVLSYFDQSASAGDESTDTGYSSGSRLIDNRKEAQHLLKTPSNRTKTTFSSCSRSLNRLQRSKCQSTGTRNSGSSQSRCLNSRKPSRSGSYLDLLEESDQDSSGCHTLDESVSPRICSLEPPAPVHDSGISLGSPYGLVSVGIKVPTGCVSSQVVAKRDGGMGETYVAMLEPHPIFPIHACSVQVRFS